MRPRESIALFLRCMKVFVSKNGLILVPRDASIQFMADENMSMSMNQLKELVLSLEPKERFDGPEADRSAVYKGWTAAEFAPEVRGRPLYLKPSIKIESKRCTCLSIKLYREREASGNG